MQSFSVPRRAPIALLAVLALGAGAAHAETLSIDPKHSHVGFSIRHLFTRVSGEFRQFEGTIEYDEAKPTNSKVSVTIQSASIDTNVEARDKDLRSAKFFEVEKYPTLTFTSTAVTDVAAPKAKVKGTLDMHGVKKEVVLDAEFLGKGKDPWGGTRYGFRGTTKIDRKDFGLTWNAAIEGGGFLVGDDVEITLDVEATVAAPPKP